MLFSVDILTFDVEDEDEDVEDEVVMIDGGCRRCTPHFLDATEDIFKDLCFAVMSLSGFRFIVSSSLFV